MTGSFGQTNQDDGAVTLTVSSAKSGIFARNDSTSPATAPAGSGVFGLTVAPGGTGVFGANNAPNGSSGRGVQGNGPEAGVGGFSDKGTGVLAQSNKGNAILATTGAHDHNAILALNNGDGQPAPTSGSPAGIGVFGVTVVPGAAGVFGANNAPSGSPGLGVQGNGPEAGVGGFSEKGIGVLAQSGQIGVKAQAPIAGRFEGDVEVTGDIRLVNADVAEDFDIASDELVPGMVTVFDAAGALCASSEPYDRRVAGVIAGAGDLRPGVILGRKNDAGRRLPIALVGRAFCNVDARYGQIDVGDLLTTSPTPGHAMKALDPQRAFGAVIGKALKSLGSGRGAIPVLIALQ